MSEYDRGYSYGYDDGYWDGYDLGLSNQIRERQSANPLTNPLQEVKSRDSSTCGRVEACATNQNPEEHLGEWVQPPPLQPMRPEDLGPAPEKPQPDYPPYFLGDLEDQPEPLPAVPAYPSRLAEALDQAVLALARFEAAVLGLVRSLEGAAARFDSRRSLATELNPAAMQGQACEIHPPAQEYVRSSCSEKYPDSVSRSPRIGRDQSFLR